MTTFTNKQIKAVGLALTEEIFSTIKDENINTIEGLKELKSELEQDNRGIVRFAFGEECAFDHMLVSYLITDGVVEKHLLVQLTQAIGKFGVEQLKAKKYAVDLNGFVVTINKTQMKKLIAQANTAHAKELANKSVEAAKEAGVPEEQIIKNEEELKEFFEVMTDETTAIDLNESTVEAPVVIDMPVADESSVAEENKPKGDVETMMYTPQNPLIADLGEEGKVALVSLDCYKEAVAKLMNAMDDMQSRYEETLNRVVDERHVAADEIVAATVATKDALIADMKADLEKYHAENAELAKQLAKVETLRKRDARKIEKLNDEMGRAKTKLREHTARQISESNITELPEEKVSGTIKARIKTASAVDNAAQTLHEKAPEKIAVAADKTKDGIQWVADVAKDGVDVSARGANWLAEKTGNAMTLAADVIAPSKGAVAKSILSMNEEAKTVTVAGTEYKLDANGKLVF